MTAARCSHVLAEREGIRAVLDSVDRALVAREEANAGEPGVQARLRAARAGVDLVRDGVRELWGLLDAGRPPEAADAAATGPAVGEG